MYDPINWVITCLQDGSHRSFPTLIGLVGFQKAFDTVFRAKLLELQLPPSVLKWVSDFIDGRTALLRVRCTLIPLLTPCLSVTSTHPLPPNPPPFIADDEKYVKPTILKPLLENYIFLTPNNAYNKSNLVCQTVLRKKRLVNNTKRLEGSTTFPDTNLINFVYCFDVLHNIRKYLQIVSYSAKCITSLKSSNTKT